MVDYWISNQTILFLFDEKMLCSCKNAVREKRNLVTRIIWSKIGLDCKWLFILLITQTKKYMSRMKKIDELILVFPILIYFCHLQYPLNEAQRCVFYIEAVRRIPFNGQYGRRICIWIIISTCSRQKYNQNKMLHNEKCLPKSLLNQFSTYIIIKYIKNITILFSNTILSIIFFHWSMTWA